MDYIHKEINPYARAVLKNEANRVGQDQETVIDAAEELRVHYSETLVHVFRATSGFTLGMFDAFNSTECGSRLTQLDEVV